MKVRLCQFLRWSRGSLLLLFCLPLLLGSLARQLTTEARKALQKVEERLQSAFLQRRQEGMPIILCVFPTYQPTTILWQEGPLLWVYPKISPNKSIEHYPTAIAVLALNGIQQSLQYFGVTPTTIIVPYSSYQIKILCGTVDDWAILQCRFDGEIDNHYPKHPLLSFFKEHPVIFPKITSSHPLRGHPIYLLMVPKQDAGFI